MSKNAARQNNSDELLFVSGQTVLQAMAQTPWPAICIMSDASPKGKLDVPGLQYVPTVPYLTAISCSHL